MALEPLTPEQRAAALDKAFKARQARAEVKTELKAGRTTLSAVLDRAGSDEALSKMKVHDLLRSLPGVGDRRAADGPRQPDGSFARLTTADASVAGRLPTPFHSHPIEGHAP